MQWQNNWETFSYLEGKARRPESVIQGEVDLKSE